MKTQATVIDLHIEKIARAYRSFSPADNLLYQVDYFEQSLQSNRFKKGMKIDFVHGNGAGVLRAELVKILNQKFPTFIYEDSPFATFGFQGAIRITIK